MAYSFVTWHDHVHTQTSSNTRYLCAPWAGPRRAAAAAPSLRVTGTEWPVHVHNSPACAVNLCAPQGGPRRAAGAVPRGAAWGAPTAPATAGRRRAARRRHARRHPGHLHHRGHLWHASWGLHAQEGGRRIWEDVYADSSKASGSAGCGRCKAVQTAAPTAAAFAAREAVSVRNAR